MPRVVAYGRRLPRVLAFRLQLIVALGKFRSAQRGEFRQPAVKGPESSRQISAALPSRIRRTPSASCIPESGRRASSTCPEEPGRTCGTSYRSSLSGSDRTRRRSRQGRATMPVLTGVAPYRLSGSITSTTSPSTSPRISRVGRHRRNPPGSFFFASSVRAGSSARQRSDRTVIPIRFSVVP